MTLVYLDLLGLVVVGVMIAITVLAICLYILSKVNRNERNILRVLDAFGIEAETDERNEIEEVAYRPHKA